jgi:CBS domain-containing protein
MSASVAVVLARKGDEVHTVHPEAELAEAVRALAERNVGALVVSADGKRVAGIISERDIVRHLAALGHDGLDRPVSDLMQRTVVTCTRDTTLDEVMQRMTEGRFRHVPVVDDGVLAGIVSIGDVVRHRLDELEVQTEALQGYVTGERV